MKKRKTAIARVTEVRVLISDKVVLYQVEWLGAVYILDSKMCLVRILHSLLTPQDMDQLCFIANDLKAPPCEAHLRCARSALGAEFVKAFIQDYMERYENLRMSTFLHMGLQPYHERPVRIRISLSDLLIIFAHDINAVERFDLYMQWFYFVLQKHPTQRITHDASPNLLLKAFFWKGVAPRQMRVNTLLYSDITERDGLILLWMAHKRPRGENVFTLLLRDVFRLLLEWVQWSLPLNLQ